MAGHADDLACLLSALEIDRADVLGISYGGEVAQALALNHPSRVRSLVLADTVSEVGPELRLIVEGWRAAARASDADLFYCVTTPWNFSPAFIRRERALTEATRARYAALDLAAVARLCDAFLDVDVTSRLGEIAVPTCILVGDQDILKGPDTRACCSPASREANCTSCTARAMRVAGKLPPSSTRLCWASSRDILETGRDTGWKPGATRLTARTTRDRSARAGAETGAVRPYDAAKNAVVAHVPETPAGGMNENRDFQPAIPGGLFRRSHSRFCRDGAERRRGPDEKSQL